MKRKEMLPELLAPAGSFEALVAAVAAGADAVYVGGRRFGARAFAKNFDVDELSRAVSYCHLHGVRLYVTVNTLIEDREMGEVLSYAAELWRLGVDALIVSDLGVIREIRRAIPEMELHASTQMSVHSTYGADCAAKLGCSRVVLARELSLSDISSVVENSLAEVEVFLHGALCVSYSGQCLFSSLVGGRSGNRGECAQPCRLPYTTSLGEGYPLSLKDLSYGEHIPALISSDVASLKIEGRMKSAGYVYTVTSIYRRLLDEARAATPKEMETLRQAFSRDGFTDSYLTGKILDGMLGVRSEGDKEESRRIDALTFEPRRHRVSAKVNIALGKPSELELYDGVRSVRVVGETAEVAESSPLSDAGVKERLSKMGGTYLSLSPEDIELSLAEGVNLSPSAINGLRRAAVEKFSDFTREPVSIVDEPKDIRGGEDAKRTTSAEFYSPEKYSEAVALYPDVLSKIDIAFLPMGAADEAILSAGGVSLPAVITDRELTAARARLSELSAFGVRAALVQNIGQISLARECGFERIYGGFRLNVTNGKAKRAYLDLGVDELILSPELTLPKARDISGGVITYGRIPLMLTERCFMREGFGCSSCGEAALTDRRGEKFPMMRESAHRNLILNSAVTYMGDRSSELERARLGRRHLLFTVESADEIAAAIEAHSCGEPLGIPVRRMGRRDADIKEGVAEKRKPQAETLARRKPQAETSEKRKPKWDTSEGGKPKADGVRISRAAQGRSKALKQKNNNGKKPNKSKYKR